MMVTVKEDVQVKITSNSYDTVLKCVRRNQFTQVISRVVTDPFNGNVDKQIWETLGDDI